MKRGFANVLLLVILVIVAVSIFLGLSFFKSKIGYKPSATPSPIPTPTSTSKPVVTGPIKVKGTLDCLPMNKKTGGPQILSCAMALKADDGSFYALNFINESDRLKIHSGYIEVTGTLIPPEERSPFESSGTINVTSIVELSASP